MRKYIIFSIAMFVIFISSACTVNKEESIIQISQEVSETSPIDQKIEEEEILKFAILSNVSIKETYRTHYGFVRLVEKTLGKPVEIIQKKTYDEVLKAFETGEVDLGFVCGYLSVLGDEKGIMDKLVMPIVGGERKYTSYIITKDTEEINTLFDLQGKSFAFSDPSSFSGYLVPKHLIKTAGFDFDQFFSSSFFTYSHDHSVAAVANDLVDATAVYSTSYEKLKSENSPLVKETKVIAEGPYVGNHPIVVNPEMDEFFREELKEIFLNMHNDEEGKAVLNRLNYDYFVEVDEDLYYPILSMINDLGNSDD